MEENKPIHNEDEVKPPNNEQQLNNPSTDETIVHSADTAEIINPPSEIKDMEVHHHSHESHGKKNWKSYFWEFLMLFLAVFCGFFAEYQLEHKIERDRAKQYVLSFYEDLITDTTRLNEMLLYDKDKIKALDEMDQCFDTISLNPLSTECMTKLVLHSRANRAFSITERTITQLANAGGFRLMKKEDADSILIYINKFKEYQDFQITVFQESEDNVRNTMNELLGFKNAQSLMQLPMSSTGTTSSNISAEMMAHGPLLFSNDAFLINKWFNQLSVYLRITKRQQQQLQGLNEKAKDLINYFKTKYRLK
ncbi:hypothetical protein WG954_05150 [Lacibacter sp. H375]|uniref:hypothetical protein n=1 Tax=Lacibacter sp. H375 TaxID=3133424 RepID=UPI0030BBF1E9